MNKEAIIKLISEPNELNKVSIEELEEMVHKYPYFHQLHVLLHSKKQLMEEKEHSEDIIEVNGEKENHVSYTHINEESDEDEFEELEEENSQLPFHDASLIKFNTNNNVSADTLSEEVESSMAIEVPEEIVEEDIARLLNKAGLANPDSADDLTLVSHITKETQNLLNNNGLYTYAQLKKLEECEEREILAKLVGKKIDAIDLWKADCDILYHNKYHRLLIEKIGLALKNQQTNLQKINGIGPIMEAKLNEIGILTYRQLALLEKPDIEILTVLIDYFPGRIERDEWIPQAILKNKEYQQAKETKKLHHDDDTEIARLKAKVEAHKNLKEGIGITAKQNNQTDEEDTAEQSRESFRDWLTKMNRASDTSDEKKNLLVNDLTNKRPT